MLNPRTTGGLKPDARYQSAMVYDSKRDRLLLFGGYGTTAYDDLWSWSSATSEWTLISVPGARPSARYGHWMFYDAVRDKVYVFGQNGSGYQNWEFDPALNAWRDRTVTSPPAGVSRSYFDVTFDSTRGKIVMLGGYYASAYNTDIWEWDTTTGVWAQLMPATGSPIADARHYHTMVYDSIRRVLVLFGGYRDVTGATGASNDSWEWDANLLRWDETTPTGVKPAPRYYHAMAFNSVRGTTYVFGGTVPDDTAYGPSEFWEYVPNATARPNGAGCSAAAADACMSGRLCRRCLLRADRGRVRRHVQVVQRRRQRRHVRQRPRRAARRHLSVGPGVRRRATVQEAAGAGVQPVQRVRDRQLHRRRLLRHRVHRQVQAVQPGREARHLLVRADG